MKSVLITGSNGFLGQHLADYLDKAGHFDITLTSRGVSRIPHNALPYHDIDLTDKEAVQKFLSRNNFDVIIHTAALSKPDECNVNRRLCLDVNVEATRTLLEGYPGFFIYISTDFIFGEDGPHSETTPPEPLNFYGESKLMAEELVQSGAEKFAIVRPVFIYGKVWPGLRPSFLHWVKNNLEQQTPIKVVSDQLRTPTYVDDICCGIQAIIDRNAVGAFHLAGKDVLSPYQMAITVAEVLGLNKSLVEKVTSETFPEPVKRAKRSGLLIKKAQNDLGYEPVSFAEGVRLSFSDSIN